MKKSIPLGILLLGMLFALPAHAQSGGEFIEHFDAKIEVHADASVSIQETVVYNFGGNQRHGIYRDIPVKYQTKLGNQSVRISGIMVADESGAPYAFTVSNAGNDEEIKIGSADVLVTGTKTYVISYSVQRVVGYFADFDELYWNVTGNGWQVPIHEAHAEMLLPAAVSKDAMRVACYEGALGSSAPCGSSSAGAQQVTFAAAGALAPGEGLTIAVGFPKGVVYEPTSQEKVWQLVKDNWVVGVPLVVLVAMFVLWYKKGRDPKGRGTVIAEYESPDSLTPLEISALMHGRVADAAVSAEIVYLATKGYLQITKIEKKGLLFNKDDYQLTKLKPGDGLPDFDRLLLDGLFTADVVTLSDLQNKFYKQLPDIKKAAIKSVVTKKYYPTDPGQVRGLYVAGSMALGFVVAFLGFATGAGQALSIGSAAAAGLVAMLFAFFMPKVTKLGAIAKEQVQGLELFITVAEKDRIKFHNAPEKNPQLFERLLPFAMVLGAEAAWAKQFEGIYMTPPGWYNDPSGGAFNAVLFTHNMHAFSAAATSTLSSAPGNSSGSGGGGFSGGGGGGGGGGSW